MPEWMTGEFAPGWLAIYVLLFVLGYWMAQS